jgi:hypothetical protein
VVEAKVVLEEELLQEMLTQVEVVVAMGLKVQVNPEVPAL